MGNKQICRPAKSVYDMTTKEYMNYLSRNHITKEWILYLFKNEFDLDKKVIEKLTLKELIEKYGDDLKDMIEDCCFE